MAELSHNQTNQKIGLKIRECVEYSSPRYFRLIFPQYKPTTKNGDLLSALGELKAARIISRDSDWNKIKLTKKGSIYKKFIKKLIEIGELYLPDGKGLLDYRSEQGRLAIIKLVGFIAGKVNIEQYFKYLNLPITEAEKDDSWLKLFSEQIEESENEDKNENEIKKDLIDKIEDASKKNKITKILEFLERKNKNKRQTSIMGKKIIQEEKFRFNLSLIKKFLKQIGFNRPVPLLEHLNSIKSEMFKITGNDLIVNLKLLNKIIEIFSEHIIDFNKNENEWLRDYFNISKMPTNIYGFSKGDFIFDSTSKEDLNNFLNIAIEGPKIFANQFTNYIDIGSLNLLIFPINFKELFIIRCLEPDIITYFTITQNTLNFKIKIEQQLYDFPEFIRSSIKRFGKLFSWSKTNREFEYSMNLQNIKDKEEKKELESELKEFKMSLKENLTSLSNYSVSIYNICNTIAQKINNQFEVNKVICFFEKGYASLNLLSSDTLLTEIKLCDIEYSSQFKKLIKKMDDSVIELLNIDGSKEQSS